MDSLAIIHVDLDAFFAAVEVLDDPSLKGRPVVVGGTPEGRGVVSTASYEARRYGIHSAMSAARARALCPHAVFLRPRFERYQELSRAVFAVFHGTTPLVEGVSLDEAYMDVRGCERLFGPPPVIGRRIQDRIRETTGLTASVGVAPNKLLAKIASDLEKPAGFVVITAADAARRLAPLPVGRIPGVGKKTAEILDRLGVRTVADLGRARRSELHAALGESFAASLLDLAGGRDARPVEPEGEPKSLGAERTFPSDVGARDELRAVMDELVEEVGERLRRHGLATRTLVLKARFPDFTTLSRSETLAWPTTVTSDLRRTARRLLEERLERGGRPLRLLGLTAQNLGPGGLGQGQLFAPAATERGARLDQAADRIHERFGDRALRWGNLVKRNDDGEE